MPQQRAGGRATKSREKEGNAPAARVSNGKGKEGNAPVAGVVSNGKEKEADGEGGSCVCRGGRPPSCGGRLFL